MGTSTRTATTSRCCGRTGGVRRRTRPATCCRGSAGDARCWTWAADPAPSPSTSPTWWRLGPGDRPGPVRGRARPGAGRGGSARDCNVDSPWATSTRWNSRTARSTWCTRTRCSSTSATRSGAARDAAGVPSRGRRRGSGQRLRGVHLVPAGGRARRWLEVYSGSPRPTTPSRTRDAGCCPGRMPRASRRSRDRGEHLVLLDARRTAPGGVGCGRTGSSTPTSRAKRSTGTRHRGGAAGDLRGVAPLGSGGRRLVQRPPRRDRGPGLGRPSRRLGRVETCVRADSAGSDVRSRRLGRFEACVRADSAGSRPAFAPTRRARSVRSRRLGGVRVRGALRTPMSARGGRTIET